MDDQHGNVIDGKARARQWRRSPAKAGAARTDHDGARSDAPKSIAGSLLVPVEMLPPLAPASEQLSEEPSRNATPPADRGVAIPAKVPADGTPRQNPFLAPDAPAKGPAPHGDRTSRRWPIAALLTSSARAIIACRPLRSTQSRRERAPRRRAAALIVVTSALTVLVVALYNDTAGTRRPDASLSEANVGPNPAALEASIRGAMTALSTEFRAAVPRTAAARSRAHATRKPHPRRRTIGARSSQLTGALSRTATPRSETPAYTPPPASNTRAASTAATPAAAPHNNPRPGPTSSDPLAGLGSCVAGCS
jgi:hypothetical protein